MSVIYVQSLSEGPFSASPSWSSVRIDRGGPAAPSQTYFHLHPPCRARPTHGRGAPQRPPHELVGMPTQLGSTLCLRARLVRPACCSSSRPGPGAGDPAGIVVSMTKRSKGGSGGASAVGRLYDGRCGGPYRLARGVNCERCGVIRHTYTQNRPSWPTAIRQNESLQGRVRVVPAERYPVLGSHDAHTKASPYHVPEATALGRTRERTHVVFWRPARRRPGTGPRGPFDSLGGRVCGGFRD